MVAEDYLVSFQANRYSVPYRLIGKTVEVIPIGELIRIEHAGQLVAEHPRLAGKHQMRILPQHVPGRRRAMPGSAPAWRDSHS